MTNTQIAEKFAEGETRGQANSMFIDGNTIFSYGYHFPIARITDKWDENGKQIALFTHRGYSNTTAKHKNHVYYALLRAEYRVITTDISTGKVDNVVLEGLSKELKELQLKHKRARKEWTRESLLEQAQQKSKDVKTLQNTYSL